MAIRFPSQRPNRLAGGIATNHNSDAKRTRTPSRVPALANRACCCLAKPAVVAVLPVIGHDGHPLDLHLCVHHYRLSRNALADADAVVFDGSGFPVTDPDPNELLDRQETA